MIAFSLVLALITTSAAIPETRIYYQWNYVNYTWPTAQVYRKAVEDGKYIAENNIISGIKVWKDRVYLSVPRLRKGVPVTLASVPRYGEFSPLLEPFPSWEMQEEGDCSRFQLVQSMEIDPKGRLWVLNNGRIQMKERHSKYLCPSSLMIFDLENNGKLLFTHTFSKEVARPVTVYLNDIVLDHEDGGFAYITDDDNTYPGIIVFSLRNRTSWKLHHESMLRKSENQNFVIQDTELMVKSNINGIALSPSSEGHDRLLFYSPLCSLNMYTLPTHVLKHNDFTNLHRYVRDLGAKPSPSDGMVLSVDEVLYFGYVTMNSVGVWDIRSQSFRDDQRILIADEESLEWPESFAIDDSGVLWNTAKKQSTIGTTGLNMSQVNFWVHKTNIYSKSYQYLGNGDSPSIPDIEISYTESIRSGLRRVWNYVRSYSYFFS